MATRKLAIDKAAIAIIMIILSIGFSSLFFHGCGGSEEHVLSTSVVPSDSGTISPSNGVFEGTVSLVASPNKYYVFKGWAGEASGDSNPLQVKMNSDKNIVAMFEREKHNLQMNVQPSGGGTVEPGGDIFEAGTQVSFTALPSAGYRFVNWGGQITGTANPISILMDRNITATANFVKQYRLAISVEPGNGGAVNPGPGLYDAGTQVELNAVPTFPYYPKKWTGTDNNNIFPTTVTMNSDKSVTVVFAPCTKGEQKGAAADVSKDALGRWRSVSSVPIQLNQFEWVQGEILWSTPNTPNTPVRSYIQDPAGNIVKDFGASKQANFTFMAQTTGRYTFVFQNDSIWYARYGLTYTPWTK